MEWLVLVCGIGLIAAVIGTVIYVNHKRRSLPLPSRHYRVYPRGTTDEITWADIPVSSSSQSEWLEINEPSEIEQISWVELEIDQAIIIEDEDFWNPLIVEDDSEDENFLDPDIPDDLDNILRDVIGAKDLLTQETFIAGEQVYLCRLHRLAYHEDSWIELGHKCPVCGNDAHTGQYRLPR